MLAMPAAASESIFVKIGGAAVESVRTRCFSNPQKSL